MMTRPGSPHIISTDTLYALRSAEAMYPSIIGIGNNLDLNIKKINTLGSVPLDDDNGALDTWALAARRVSVVNDDTSTKINIESAAYPNSNVAGINSRVVRFSSQRFLKVQEGREAEGDYKNIYGMQVKMTLPTVYSAKSLQVVTNNMLTNNGTESRANKTSLAPRNGTVTVQMPHPVVVTECVETSIPLHPDSAVTYMVHGQGRRDLTLANLNTLGALAEAASTSTLRSSDEIRYHAPVWKHSAAKGSPSLIGVFITDALTSSNSDTLSQIPNSTKNGSVVVMTCTISAFWESGQIHLRPTWSDEFVMTHLYAQSQSHNKRDISLNITDIYAVHDAQFHADISYHSTKWAEKDSFGSRWGRAAFPLTAMFALGLSKIPRVTARPLEQKGWDDSVYIKDLVWCLPPQVDSADASKIKFSVTSYGYGYGTRTTSIHLAMTVILTYCIITFMYITYTIITGSASTAWNSGIELVTLVLQSRKPAHLGHASVGIDSIKTFSEGVGVRVNTDDELELVFANDRDFHARKLRKIERNKEY
ncbi:hypothetical protein DE146DRAFT_639322 [Phaeosphaeria sp. MPI-PUGE-AT-0046c]|nr:hypothetical protein DE146DRAFT_639322 [Phaeosphaeria sp. MPI-PUGE-AT-0046c]